ncbi:MAG: hypothetical protein IKD37_07465 [Clostridia bacterium]|nr:hypothetical protein [Clostridia bacterium]
MHNFSTRNQFRRISALALALSLLVLSACRDKEQPDPSLPDPLPAQTTTVPDTKPVSPAPDDTAAPQDTTAVPAAETTQPTPVTTAPTISASGSFCSETGSNLEIFLDWAVIGQTDSAVTVRAEAYITHYEIWVSARHGGTLKIGNSSQSFSTPALSYDGRTKQTVPLATATVDVPLEADHTATVTFSVSWPFIGTYSGIRIDNLTCGGTVTIGTPAPVETSTPPPETTAPPAETTAVPAAPVEPQQTAAGTPVLFQTALYIDRDVRHFGSVTLVRSTDELARLLAAHPADCTAPACASIVSALSAHDAAFFAGHAILLIPQGNLSPTASPIEIFDMRTDDGTLHVHVRELFASRTAAKLSQPRFFLLAAQIPADALTGRIINVIQHGAYYTDTGKYEREYLLEAGTVTSPTVRAYQPAAIIP